MQTGACFKLARVIIKASKWHLKRSTVPSTLARPFCETWSASTHFRLSLSLLIIIYGMFDVNFHALWQSFAMIIFSEIGDKTFLIGKWTGLMGVSPKPCPLHTDYICSRYPGDETSTSHSLCRIVRFADRHVDSFISHGDHPSSAFAAAVHLALDHGVVWRVRVQNVSGSKTHGSFRTS